MKTKLLLLASLFSVGMIFSSCQKDNELNPEINLEQPDSPGSISGEDYEFVEPDDIYFEDPISNYPDPFINVTNIEYKLKRTVMIRLSVYQTNSTRVILLYEGVQYKGTHVRKFDATNLPAGEYVAELKIGNYVAKQTMHKISKWDSLPVDPSANE